MRPEAPSDAHLREGAAPPARRSNLLLATCSLLAIAAAGGASGASPAKGGGHLDALQKAFPGSVESGSAGRSIEFCPDNTCDSFVGKRGVPGREVAEFAFLFVYFFSNYDSQILAPLRTEEAPARVARTLLAEPRHRACANVVAQEAARCVLRRLARKDRIQVYFVRYDEGQRNAVPAAVP